MLQYVTMLSKVTWKSGLELTFAFEPLNRQRLAADQPLIDARSLQLRLSVSPSHYWYLCVVDATVGELPDYYNAKAGHGYSFNISQQVAVHRDINIQLNGTWATSRADNSLVSGATIQEGALLLLINYQVRAYSRLRWTASWQRSFGWTLSTSLPAQFSDSALSQSVSWIHEPRVGLGYSITIAEETVHTNGARIHNARGTAKVGYALW